MPRPNARAQRTYRALGFEEMVLADEEMAGLEVAVDGFPDHSFLMVKHLERLS